LSAESARLGVKQLTEFNTALLGKWCWRMLVDKRGLWYRVLVARYGEVAGRVAAGGETHRGGGKLLGFGMGWVRRRREGGLGRVL
jgi:hypothetical protein